MGELGRGCSCLELNASAVMRDDWLIKLNIPTHQLDLKMAFGIRGLKVDGNTWPCKQISKQQKVTYKQNQQSINTNKIIHKHQFCFDLIVLVNNQNNTQNRTLSAYQSLPKVLKRDKYMFVPRQSNPNLSIYYICFINSHR